MKTKFIVVFSCCLFSWTYAQVGIGTTQPQTTLDIRGSNHLGAVSETDGILVPRVNALTSSGTVDGQLVYLIADNGSFSKGFHYWDAGATGWLPVNSTIEPWNEAGTTNPATLNTDNLYTLGKVGIGRTNPTGILHIQHSSNDNDLDDVMIDSYSNATTSFFGLRKARGTVEAPLNLQNGDNIGWITFVPRYNGNLGYLGSSIASFYRGNGTDNVSDLVFQTNGNQDRMRLTPEGNLGINVYDPTARLQVNGTFRYVDASPGDDEGKVLTSDANGNASWQDAVVYQMPFGMQFYSYDIPNTTSPDLNDLERDTVVTKSGVYNGDLSLPNSGVSVLNPTSDGEGFVVKIVGTYLVKNTGEFSFTQRSDDGARIYIDGTLVLSDWANGGANTTTSQPIALAKGKHKFEFWYYEFTSNQEFSFSWGTNPDGNSGVIQANQFTIE
ncbi:PA14 domain-containing protein [Leeuwenhoekiella sp. H156]|uniref:PA14 domain-containing protein n=1 Tax=Leeuwenhoekiella sp. H156 TaxID=3450128 RepID=UPI003FA441C1